MEYGIKTGHPDQQRADCLVVPVFAKGALAEAAKVLDQANQGIISKLLKRGDLAGEVGETALLPAQDEQPARRLLVVGCGNPKELNELKFKKIVCESINALKKTGAKDIVSYLHQMAIPNRDEAWQVEQTIGIAEALTYRFDRLQSKKRPPAKKGPARLFFGVAEPSPEKQLKRAIAKGAATAHGVALAKNVANLPSNYCTPVYLADQAKALEKKFAVLKVKVLSEANMQKLGMGALLSVAKGSAQAPRFIIIDYPGTSPESKPTVLIGKGITFDSGGISIKPALAMDEMKFDMCGAASVLGILAAVAEMKLPMRIIGLIPACENMPSGTANKPGDVVTSLSGQTIEILNTDAEGRLILCDALTYAERYKPKAVIDIATLTGACVIALGAEASGLLSNHQPLAQQLLEAGERVGDRCWQLPLWEEYQKQLDTNFADIANIGGRDAGTITAACFLSRFAKKFHWAHLDIAGTAWLTGKNKGATGRPVPLMVDFFCNQ